MIGRMGCSDRVPVGTWHGLDHVSLFAMHEGASFGIFYDWSDWIGAQREIPLLLELFCSIGKG